MKYPAVNLSCSTSCTEGLGSTLSTKHFPLGKTNLVGFNKPGFSTGLAGISKLSISAELTKGRDGSIPGARVSEVTKLEVFLAGLAGTAGDEVTIAAGLTLPCTLFHRLTAVDNTGWAVWLPTDG